MHESLDFLMRNVGLNENARPGLGRVGHYWFESPALGLELARYHRFVIPLGSFDTRSAWVPQPESPELTIEWVQVASHDPAQFASMLVERGHRNGAEASVYLGASRNWIELEHLELVPKEDQQILRGRCPHRVPWRDLTLMQRTIR